MGGEDFVVAVEVCDELAEVEYVSVVEAVFVVVVVTVVSEVNVAVMEVVEVAVDVVVEWEGVVGEDDDDGDEDGEEFSLEDCVIECVVGTVELVPWAGLVTMVLSRFVTSREA
jgi:hypothetical protein